MVFFFLGRPYYVYFLLFVYRNASHYVCNQNIKILFSIYLHIVLFLTISAYFVLFWFSSAFLIRNSIDYILQIITYLLLMIQYVSMVLG